MHARHRIAGTVLALLLTPPLMAGEGAGNGAGETVPPADLRQVYRQALEADPELGAQRYRLEALKEQRREALAGLLPQVTASGEIRDIRRDQTNSGLGGGTDESLRDFDQTRYSAQILQPLFDLPAWRGLQRGDDEIDRGQAELEAARQDLVLRVTEAYLGVLSAQSELALARSEYEAMQAAHERVQGLYEEDLAAVTDLEEVRARRDSARARVIRAEGELRIAREALTRITDRRYAQLAGLRPGVELPGPGGDDLQAWVERALQANPRIAAARAGVQTATTDIRAARARHYPSLDLVAGYSYLDDLDGSAYGRVYEDEYIGLQLNVPIYSGGGVGARARGAARERDRQRQALEATRREVRANVRAAYEGLASGRAEIRALKQSVRSNERSVEAVDAAFRAGLRPLADVLDAQRELFAARRDLARARHEYLLDLFRLRQGAGALDENDIDTLNRVLATAP
ncbi:TolC family outer membrane protein [Ectothiorhodospira mobilis]|uniref:TolC family outer membrane protein n=1 Tax=Ectothiorhodospira mobilis TaxID=195064 RepID=UPI002378C982|nr:TolC family outer membrane protein [Ectothiorhodospira mobilis]